MISASSLKESLQLQLVLIMLSEPSLKGMFHYAICTITKRIRNNAVCTVTTAQLKVLKNSHLNSN